MYAVMNIRPPADSLSYTKHADLLVAAVTVDFETEILQKQTCTPIFLPLLTVP